MSSVVGGVAGAALGIAGAGLVGSLISGNASQSAANTQANAANNATAAQQGMFNLTNSQSQPWRQAGRTALGSLTDMIGGTNNSGTNPGGINVNSPFTAQDLQSNLAPNYQFMLHQGQSTINHENNATGGMIGGNALQGLDQFTQNYAGNAYQNAFNNYQTQNSNIFNRLSNLAGLGGQANQTTANAAGTFGTNMGQTIMGSGAAQAAGTVGVANALNGGLGSMAGTNYLYGSGAFGSPATSGTSASPAYFGGVPSSGAALNALYPGP